MKFLKNIHDNELPDTALVERYRNSGDMQVLSALFQRYMDLLYGVCFKHLKDPAQAKDAVMQVFEELVYKLKKHEVENFRSWVFMVTRNHCLMQLRSAKNFKTVEFQPDHMQSQEEMHQYGILEKEENLQRLEKCLETLTPDQRGAVRLFYLENKCYKDISAITGTDLNTIRSFIQNGRRNLKICIEKNSNARVQ